MPILNIRHIDETRYSFFQSFWAHLAFKFPESGKKFIQIFVRKNNRGPKKAEFDANFK